jgi:hypothetical protein
MIIANSFVRLGSDVLRRPHPLRREGIAGLPLVYKSICAERLMLRAALGKR